VQALATEFGNSFLFFSIVLLLGMIFWPINLYLRDKKKPDAEIIANSRHIKGFIALIAAANEEIGIEAAVRSLRRDRHIEFATVIVNNSKDHTMAILRNLQQEFADDWLIAVEMKNNKYKKAGALNHGYALIKDALSKRGQNPTDYALLSLDADTIISRNTCGKILETFSRDERAAGVCVFCAPQDINTLKHGAKPKLSERILHAYQEVEYSMAFTTRYAQNPYVKVLPGACCAYRIGVLEYVEESFGAIWKLSDLAEDADLTRKVQELGFTTPTCGAIAFTDIPLDFKALYRQRIRWYSGAMVMLRRQLRKRFSWRDLCELITICIQPLFIPVTVAIIAILATQPSLAVWFGIPFFVTLSFNATRYIARRRRIPTSPLGYIIAFSPILMMPYGLWEGVIWVHSIIRSYSKREQRW